MSGYSSANESLSLDTKEKDQEFYQNIDHAISKETSPEDTKLLTNIAVKMRGLEEANRQLLERGQAPNNTNTTCTNHTFITHRAKKTDLDGRHHGHLNTGRGHSSSTPSTQLERDLAFQVEKLVALVEHLRVDNQKKDQEIFELRVRMAKQNLGLFSRTVSFAEDRKTKSPAFHQKEVLPVPTTALKKTVSLNRRRATSLKMPKRQASFLL